MCGHAVGSPLEYAGVALRRELAEIGFSDHLMVDKWRPGYAMKLSEVPRYVRLIKDTQKRFASLPIKLGVEVDYFPGKEDAIRTIIEAYPFDYVLGSVHSIDDWTFDDERNIQRFSEWDIDRLYENYFDLLQEAASSKLFDVMAHPDVIKKFGHRARMDLHHIYAEVARTFRRAGVCMEVNTSGLRWPIRELYPAKDLLDIALKRDVPATLGSDAHHPSEVAADFEVAVNLLRNAGYKSIAVFNQRQRSAFSI